MTALERVQRDHALFRVKLATLESALQFGEEARFVIRELCFTLSRQLASHVRRESQLASLCTRALWRFGSGDLGRLALEHHEEWQWLRLINRSVSHAAPGRFEELQATLTGVIPMWRSRMAEQEAQLFPLLTQTLGGTLSVDAEVAGGVPVRLVESMTGREVVRRYPKARAVFERLFIDIDHEGYYGLDEIAWRHGFGSRQLLAQLEDTIASRGRARVTLRPRVRAAV
jgi:hypothetical protein